MLKQVICSVNRGGLEESQHNIHSVVINQDRQIIFQSGDVNASHCLRSTLKPFQSAASISFDTHAKYNFTSKEIAVTCASHHCEDQHLATIRSILKKANIPESALGCGFHFPFDKANKAKLYSNQIEKSNIYNNCSGKHAGLLSMIKTLNLSIDNYIDHNHPIHQHINQYILDIAETSADCFAVDGCSLPTPYFSLLTLAKMYMKLIVAPKGSPLEIVSSAIMKHPELISGTQGFDTNFMKTLHGRAVCKGGAEGMQALSFKTKNQGYITLVLKVLDGNHRGNYISCITILNYLNLITNKEHQTLLQHIDAQQYNLNKIKTGELICKILD